MLNAGSRPPNKRADADCSEAAIEGTTAGLSDSQRAPPGIPQSLLVPKVDRVILFPNN